MMMIVLYGLIVILVYILIYGYIYKFKFDFFKRKYKEKIKNVYWNMNVVGMGLNFLRSL